MRYLERLASIRGPPDVMTILLLSQVLLYMMLSFKLQLRYQGLVGRGLTHKGAWKVDVGEGVEAMQQLLQNTNSVWHQQEMRNATRIIHCDKGM